jgi:hypothetical protein
MIFRTQTGLSIPDSLVLLDLGKGSVEDLDSKREQRER